MNISAWNLEKSIRTQVEQNAIKSNVSKKMKSLQLLLLFYFNFIWDYEFRFIYFDFFFAAFYSSFRLIIWWWRASPIFLLKIFHFTFEVQKLFDLFFPVIQKMRWNCTLEQKKKQKTNFPLYFEIKINSHRLLYPSAAYTYALLSRTSIRYIYYIEHCFSWYSFVVHILKMKILNMFIAQCFFFSLFYQSLWYSFVCRMILSVVLFLLIKDNKTFFFLFIPFVRKIVIIVDIFGFLKSFLFERRL